MIMKSLLLSMLVVLISWNQVNASLNQVNAQNASVVDVINNFQVQLYNELAKTNPNHVCSGFSVATSIHLLLAGARTTTEKELLDLGYTAAGLTKQQAFDAYHDILTKQRSPHIGYELNIANTILIQSGLNVLPEYSSTLRDVFCTQENMVNFTNPTSIIEAARLISNSVTKKPFPTFFDAPVIDPSTRLMLVSALYFNGTFKHKFDKKLTAFHPFNNGTTTKDIEFMNTVNVFNYYEDDEFQLLELPYVGDDLVMIVMLPRTVTGLPDLEKCLNRDKHMMVIRNLRPAMVHVKIPKFVAYSSLRLSDVLKRFGMKTAFTPAADLTGITSEQGLFVSEFIQTALVGVNEDGALSASASTTVVKREACDPHKEVLFTADRPFRYSVFHRPTGLGIFVGRFTEV